MRQFALMFVNQLAEPSIDPLTEILEVEVPRVSSSWSRCWLNVEEVVVCVGAVFVDVKLLPER